MNTEYSFVNDDSLIVNAILKTDCLNSLHYIDFSNYSVSDKIVIEDAEQDTIITETQYVGLHPPSSEGSVYGIINYNTNLIKDCNLIKQSYFGVQYCTVGKGRIYFYPTKHTNIKIILNDLQVSQSTIYISYVKNCDTYHELIENCDTTYVDSSLYLTQCDSNWYVEDYVNLSSIPNRSDTTIALGHHINNIPILRDTCIGHTELNEHGCERYYEICYKVTKGIYIPNAISPNNDGINDIFEIHDPKGYINKLIDIKFYTRWGAEIIIDANTQNDVYIYYIKFINFRNELEVIGGDFTVLK